MLPIDGDTDAPVSINSFYVHHESTSGIVNCGVIVGQS